jgi:photosystem II stability/assembly factor-like uncharacterized protein
MKPIIFTSLLHSVLFLLIFLGMALVAMAQRNVWIRTGGPLGGLGYDIRMNPLNPDIMFVTDGFAGVFKSIDGGSNWFPSNNGIPRKGGPSGDALPIFCLTIDPNDPDIVWAGMQQQRGIFKSLDSGNTWQEKDNGVIETTGITFRGFSVDPRSSDIVYAAGEISSTIWAGKDSVGAAYDKTKGVLYKSTDGGENWTSIWRGDNLARYILIHPNNPDTLYLSTGIFDREAANSDHTNNIAGGVGILKSLDGGQTWEQKNNGLTSLYIGTLFMHPTHPDILLAGSALEAYPGEHGVFLTTNGGDNWTKVLNDRAESVEFSLSNPQIAYAGNDAAVYKSSDGGQNWRKVSTGENSWGTPEIQAGVPIDFQVDPRNPDRLFANNYGGGNFLTEDGGVTWQVASAGYTGVEVRDIAISPVDPMRVYAAARSGIFASSNGGQEWEGLNYGPARAQEWTAVAVNPANPQQVVASNKWFPTILVSLDAAETWQDTQFSIPEGKTWQTFVFAPSDSQTIYAGTENNVPGPTPAMGIYRSIDGGQSWAPVNDTLSQNANIAELAVDPQNSQVVFAATKNKGVLKTADGGVKWDAINDGLPENASVFSIAIDPADAQTIFMGTELSGLYKSSNGGGSWTLVTAGLPAELNVTSVIFNPANPAMLFVGGLFSGVSRSTNNGQTWQQINDGLRTRAVNKLAISTDGQFLYAATFGEGVFRLNDAGGPVHVFPEQQIPVSFKLEQNYPNPFNPATAIRYTLRQNTRVKLRILNLLGEEVLTLVDKQQDSGSYSVNWSGKDKDGRGVASGVYLYRLKVGDLVAIKKMLLIH